MLFVAAACGAAPSPTPEPFIAFARDFSGYARWEQFTFSSSVAQGASHVSGERVLFLNHAPPAGATAFPVGTLIVKTVASTNQVFAMAKRGGGFNADGAVGWEWFELEGTADAPLIRWRGLGPPDGESYGGPGNSGCNNCHTGAWSNDFVQSEPLRLGGP